MKKLLVALNVLLVALIVGVGFFWQPEGPRAPLPLGGNFTLDGPQGPVSLQDYSGKLVLLYFGYTYCPDICPTSLMVWQQALTQLTPAERARVQPIFVSVDPERDNVARLEEYSRFFHPAIVGLTGTPDRLKEIAGRYGAVFARQEGASAGGYVIDHTAVTYVIDAEGRMVANLPHGATADQLLAEIRKYLPLT